MKSQLRKLEDNKDSATLLSLPLSDFPSLKQHQQKKRRRTGIETSQQEEDEHVDDMTNNDAAARHRQIDPPLLLIQLPKSLDVQDFLQASSPKLNISSTNGSDSTVGGKFGKRSNGNGPYFAIQDEDDLANDDDIVLDHSNAPDECNLIFESKGKTFSMMRMETSNSYVLVPPSSDTNNVNGNDDTITTSTTTPDNKTSSTSSMMRMNARLLRESNTFFLECVDHDLDSRRKQKRKMMMNALLSQHTYPPTTPMGTDTQEQFVVPSSWGYTVSKLAKRLSCSRKEVKRDLVSMNAFAIPSAMIMTTTSKDGIPTTSNSNDAQDSQEYTNKKYGVLSEEMEQHINLLIVSTLSEWQGADDYFEKGVASKQMIQEVSQRAQEGNYDDQSQMYSCDFVIRYCLQQFLLESNGTLDEDENQVVRIDVDKVAIFIAHHLFQSQSTPWQRETFLSEWNQLMPGIGEVYTPKLELLKGLALSADNIDPVSASATSELASQKGHAETKHADENSPASTSVQYLKYFPSSALPTDASSRFRDMFEEQDLWTKEDLECYLKPLLDTGHKISDLLLDYTHSVPDEKNEGKFLYSKRRS